MTDDDAFDAWLAEIDEKLQAVAGVSRHDLSDFLYHQAWADEREAKDVVQDLLEREGFPFDDVALAQLDE